MIGTLSQTRRNFSVVVAAMVWMLNATLLLAAPQTLPRIAPAEQAKSYKLMLNEVAYLQASDGGKALIQFTNFATGGTYRWRYLPPKAAGEQRGTGDVRESLQRFREPDGNFTVKPLPDHHVKVLAGGVTCTWSARNPQSCWIYVFPSKAKVEVLPEKEFERSW
jgi:hypothetical protein